MFTKNLLNRVFKGFLISASMAPLLLAAAPAPKWSVVATASQGTVEFLAIGRPSALKVRGKANGAEAIFKVEGTNATGEAKFTLASLDTGIGMRTKHMKERYLEVEKFPESKLVLSRLALPEALAKGDGKAEGVPFEGTLTLHGTQKPVTGKVALERKGGNLSADAAFTVKIADYLIPNPGYMGITMADDVEVNVKFNAPIKTE